MKIYEEEGGNEDDIDRLNNCKPRLGPLGFLSLGNDTIFGNQVHLGNDFHCID